MKELNSATIDSDIKQWKYVHIEIPIYKYPFINMMLIFIPILILSVISLFIFTQANGNRPAEEGHSLGSSTLGNRLGSVASIMIAYVSLIPVIR